MNYRQWSCLPRQFHLPRHSARCGPAPGLWRGRQAGRRVRQSAPRSLAHPVRVHPRSPRRSGCHPLVRAPPWACPGCQRSSTRAHTDLSSPAENAPGPAWEAVLLGQDCATPVAKATKATWMRALFGFFLSKLLVRVRSRSRQGLQLSPAKITNLRTYSQPRWVLLLETHWVRGGKGLWQVITATTDSGRGVVGALSIQADNSQTICGNRTLTHSLAAASQEASLWPLQPSGPAVRTDPHRLWCVLPILSSQGKAEKRSVPQSRHTRCPSSVVCSPSPASLSPQPPAGHTEPPAFHSCPSSRLCWTQCWWPTPSWKKALSQ